MGSLVDETAPAILGLGVGRTRKVRSPWRLTSGLSAVRTLIAGAQAPSASRAAAVRSCVVRMCVLLVCESVVAAWLLHPTCQASGAWRAGRQSHCGVAGLPSRRPRAAWRSRSCAVVNPEHNCAELDRLVECWSRRDLGVGGGGMDRLRLLWRQNNQSRRNYTVAGG